jgi:hypothetical protein
MRFTMQLTSSPTRPSTRQDVLALGLAHLLQDHLLGRLRRNAAQRSRSASESGSASRSPRWRRTWRSARLISRFSGSVTGSATVFTRRSDVAGLLVEVGDQILLGPELLARGHEHGVLDGVEDDLRVDALFLAQDLDGLINLSIVYMSAREDSSRILS